MCTRILRIRVQRSRQYLQILRAAGEHVVRHKLPRQVKIAGPRMPQSLPTISSVVGDQRVFVRGELAWLALICDRRGIIAGEHRKRLGEHSQTHVLRRDVQYAIGIIAEMMQVRLPKLLEQKLALWKSHQPFPCKLLRLFLLSLRLRYRNEFLSRTKIVRGSVRCKLEVRLWQSQISFARQELS